jgi:tetratricopeptide (TPR) repeat protein
MAAALELAEAFVRSGRLAECEEICRGALKSDPAHPRALCLLASAANARKAHRQALELLARIRDPGLAYVHVEKAVAHLGLGGPEAALREAQRAVEISPDVVGGHWLISRILLPGEPYYGALQRFHARLKPRSYLEIGVDEGASIALANPPTVAVGIDPDPKIKTTPKTVCKIFQLRSDDYFSQRDARQDLEADTVDLAFIDGLHTFEQVLRDFINVEKLAGDKTVVLIHDCFAIDNLTAERERKTIFWTGDVWKIIPILREFRPDLNVFTIPAPPSGVGVVTGLDPLSTVLADQFDEIVARYWSLPVEPDVARRRQQLAAIANDWAQVEARLFGSGAAASIVTAAH